MHLLIDHQGRRQTAGAQTGHRFHGKEHIVGGVFFLAQPQLLPECLQNRGRVANVAGSAIADLDDVLTLCLKGEVLIEGGDRVRLGFGDPDLLGNIAQQLRRKIAVLRLNILHNGDQGPCIPDVTGNDLVRFAVIGYIQHVSLPPCAFTREFGSMAY